VLAINREGCDRNGIQHKNTLGCMAGLTLVVICVPAELVVERGMSERGPMVNQGTCQIQTGIKEVWVFVLMFFMFLTLFYPGSP